MGMVGELTKLTQPTGCFSPMHGDGWDGKPTIITAMEFFPYAWGWLVVLMYCKVGHDVFPLCMGMVGSQRRYHRGIDRFSPMHGDGWMIDTNNRNVIKFFPYAWGWLAMYCLPMRSILVFPLCMGMVGRYSAD